MDRMDLSKTIRDVYDFPKKGIVFKDITTLFKDPKAFHVLMNRMVCSFDGMDVDVVVGPEARGFTVSAVLAYAMHAGFVPVRKPGKLPAETISYTYDLEYGSDTIEIHKDAIQPGHGAWPSRTTCWPPGGTAKAACKLVESLGGQGGGRALCHRAGGPRRPGNPFRLRRGRHR